MKKSVDVIVLGATGYTGKCIVKYLASITGEKYVDVKWGIAGRSKDRLQNLVQELNEAGFIVDTNFKWKEHIENLCGKINGFSFALYKLIQVTNKNTALTAYNAYVESVLRYGILTWGSHIKDLTIIECDIENKESLKELLQVTKVVINSTGPNVLLSPLIVDVCIETGTHYVDISAEMFHILKLYQNYHQFAESSNVLIIPSCGFASIPVEAGMIYLEKIFEGTLHSVDCYTELNLPIILPRTLIHIGTWTSTVCVLETTKQHLALKRELFPVPVEPEPVVNKRSFFFKNNGRTWFPWPGPDPDVTEMSQRYLYEKTQKSPVRMTQSTTVQNFLHYIVVPVIYLYYYLCYFVFFRKWLVKFPGFFTAGIASEKGPTNKMRQDLKYSTTFYGKGWESGSDLKSKPTKALSIKVSGQDPGYHTTAVAIVSCAITILKESSNMPKGGVIMPGAAFFKTDIVTRLEHGGYTFEVFK